MKFSELDIDKLSDEDVFDLIMSGITDIANNRPTNDNNPDFLIVLGCSPTPLKARVVKMMQLYKNGYGKYVLLSGGKGWHKLFKAENKKFRSDDERSAYMRLKAKKYKEMKVALKKSLFDDMVDKKLEGKHGKTLYKYMGKRLKQALDESEAEIAYKIMKAAQEAVNIPDDKLFFEQESLNTIQNLDYSKVLLDELQDSGKIGEIKRIMVITSAYHCRRSMLSFKKFFTDVEVMVCPSTLDIKEKGLQLKKDDLMKNNFFMNKCRNEINAIVNYTRNKNIADAKIEDVIDDKDVVRRIIMHQEFGVEI